jgi:hypothetical protein
VSVEERLVSALNRITSSTSVIRTRKAEAERATRHGETNGHLESLVVRLERVAKKLEDSLA